MVNHEISSLFEGLEHQTIAINLLQASLRNNKIAPAYLFSGPKGVGQNTSAIRFLEGLININIKKESTRFRLEKLNHPDLLWVEPTYIIEGKLIKKSTAKAQGFKSRVPSQIRLEQIREVTRFLSRKPVESKIGMIVLEDVESMNESASNALLKTLEEPMNGILILTSSRKDRLLNTIKSRCQEIPFKGLNSNLMKKEFSNNELEDDLRKHEEVLLNLSNGSPELLKNNMNLLQDIPREIINKIEERPSNSLEALSISKDIVEALNLEEQLWLIDFLQQEFWNKDHCLLTANRFEELRKHLLASVQPRISWEIALIELVKFN